jgi:hypothetical protein
LVSLPAVLLFCKCFFCQSFRPDARYALQREKNDTLEKIAFTVGKYYIPELLQNYKSGNLERY